VRRATDRELRVLVSQLETSLLEESVPRSDFAVAIAEHRELVARRRERFEEAAACVDAAGAHVRVKSRRPITRIRLYRQRRTTGREAAARAPIAARHPR
jgi:hypothetical protein